MTRVANADDFDLKKLLYDVFAPKVGEVVTILVDLPDALWPDTNEWQARREMANTWLNAFKELGLRVNSLVSYPTTGIHNGELPGNIIVDGLKTPIDALLASTNIVVAMTTFSATAPLLRFTKVYKDLRVASMPGVIKEMERTALSVDHHRLRTRVKMLQGLLNAANKATVSFSTGHVMQFDLRHRVRAMADAGECHPGSDNFRFVNLPSGEAFIVPYEGEIPDDNSTTNGEIPSLSNGKLVVFAIKGNRITGVSGEANEAKIWVDFFEKDPGRANVAEFGLGCNDRAVVRGIVLEDEKAGFHWAYGRNDHFLDGHTGISSFRSPENVIHNDIVYAKGSPIEVKRLTLSGGLLAEVTIIEDGSYVAW